MASLCASLSSPVVGHCLATLRQIADHGRTLRKESYGVLLGLAALADERFLSATIRQRLKRLRTEQSELSVHVDEDLSAGWMALKELEKRLQADQLICSDKIVALISNANVKYFWSAESMFRLYGNTALDIDDLHKHSQELLVRLKQRCRREIGLGR
jgi:hypothetical protein